MSVPLKNISLRDLGSFSAELLRERHSIWLTVTGDSMTPFLKSGDEVLLEPAGSWLLEKGMIVLIHREENKLLLHRVYRIKNDGIYLLGDAQTRPEGPFPPEQLLAAVTRIRHAKEPSVSLPAPYGFTCRLWMLLRPLRRKLLRVYSIITRLKK